MSEFTDVADANEQPFSLEQLYGAIEQHLQAGLPGLKSVSTWPGIEGSLRLPAIVLELAEAEPGQDMGTGVTTLVCKFEARVIVDPIRGADVAHRQAVHLATQLAVLLRGQSWGLAVEPAEFVQATPDWTKPDLDSYLVWVVEWTQQVYLGAEEWPWPDEPGGNLMWAFNDDTGPGNQDKYVDPENLENLSP